MYYGMIERGYTEDFLNKEKKRNIRNVAKHRYNCGGYALGCFSWYLPYEEGTYFEETTLKENIEVMLRDFPNLRIIHSLEELKENEFPIAYRCDSERYRDFHFVKRGKNKVWYHKRGPSRSIETMTEKEVFSDCWADIYDGEITLFAMKEG